MLNEVVIIPKPDYISYDEITQLLHEAYSEKLEQGLRFSAATQSTEDTIKRVGKGICLVALFDSKLVGTLTFNISDRKTNRIWYHDKKYCLFSQFATYPKYKKLGIGKKMLKYMEKIAFNENVDAIYCDTAASSYWLIKWYQRMGYTKIGYISHSSTNYYSVILRKPIHGKNINMLCVKIRFYISKIMCILQYKKDGSVRSWRLMVNKIRHKLMR